MGGKKKRNRQAASIAQANSGQILADQSAAQAQYDADLQGLRDFEVTDFYKDLQASNIDLGALERIMPRAFEGQAAQADGREAARTSSAAAPRSAHRLPPPAAWRGRPWSSTS